MCVLEISFSWSLQSLSPIFLVVAWLLNFFLESFRATQTNFLFFLEVYPAEDSSVSRRGFIFVPIIKPSPTIFPSLFAHR
jgi:hypothetical protein